MIFTIQGFTQSTFLVATEEECTSNSKEGRFVAHPQWFYDNHIIRKNEYVHCYFLSNYTIRHSSSDAFLELSYQPDSTLNASACLHCPSIVHCN